MPETLHSRLFRIIVVWLLALCPAVVVAAAARVSNLNISHGLPDNYVTGVAQDRQGSPPRKVYADLTDADLEAFLNATVRSAAIPSTPYSTTPSTTSYMWGQRKVLTG